MFGTPSDFYDISVINLYSACACTKAEDRFHDTPHMKHERTIHRPESAECGRNARALCAKRSDIDLWLLTSLC